MSSGQTSDHSSVDGHPIDETRPDALQDVRRRRELGQELHPLRQDRDAVVDAAHQQDQRLEHEGHLGAAFHVQQGQDGGHHADADERRRAEDHDHGRSDEVRVRQVEAEEQRQHHQDDGRVDQAVHDREHGRAEQLHPAPDGRHEGVLERALPALPGHRLGDEAEDDGQVVPEDGADHQREHQLAGCPAPRR